MKFCQLNEYNMRKAFIQNSCKKWGRETSSRPLFVFWERFIWDKSKWSAADLLEKGLVSRSQFVYDFSGKMFLILYSINWLNFIVRLFLLLETRGNVCIAVVYFPSCNVINFEINLIFLIKPFFYIAKKSRQNLNVLRTKRAFRWNKKHFSSILKDFHLSKIVSVLRVCYWYENKRMEW